MLDFSTFDFRLSTFDFRLSTFDFRLSTFNFQLSTFNFQLSTFDFRLSTFDFSTVDILGGYSGRVLGGSSGGTRLFDFRLFDFSTFRLFDFSTFRLFDFLLRASPGAVAPVTSLEQSLDIGL